MKTFLILFCLMQTWALAQGRVNVNNRGSWPVQWASPVTEPDGSGLLGTNYVAQIIYGASLSPADMTNELGAVMR